MLNEITKAERVQWARVVLESTARKRAARLMLRERNSLIDKLVGVYSSSGSSDSDADPMAEPRGADDSRLCRSLVAALNRRRGGFVDSSVARASAWMGQEAMAFLDIDEAINHERLRTDIRAPGARRRGSGVRDLTPTRGRIPFGKEVCASG